MNVKYRQLEESEWTVTGGSLQRLQLTNNDLTVFYIIDPTTLNGLGFTKTSVVPAATIAANFKYPVVGPRASSNLTIPNAAHFTQSNWNSFGWTVTNETTFAQDIAAFMVNNFASGSLNQSSMDVSLCLVFGTIQGTAYAIPLIQHGGGISSSYVPPFITATGGTITTSGNFKIHTFTSGSSFVISSGPKNPQVDVLLVGGGGGGASSIFYFGGGGGGGGVLYSTGVSTGGTGTFTVNVGSGGSGGNGGAGGNGGNSTAFGLTAIGGGGGACSGCGNAADGGSGGGAGGGSAGNGTSGQGFAGGAATNGSGGGGGGAGGQGGNASGGINNVAFGGNGGPGVSNSITGTAVTYGGGGGGSGCDTGHGGAGGSGGSGGGGNGVYGPGGGGGGTSGLGGGGGAGGANGATGNNPGGAGGSGVVIIRYRYQ